MPLYRFAWIQNAMTLSSWVEDLPDDEAAATRAEEVEGEAAREREELPPDELIGHSDGGVNYFRVRPEDEAEARDELQRGEERRREPGIPLVPPPELQIPPLPEETEAWMIQVRWHPNDGSPTRVEWLELPPNSSTPASTAGVSGSTPTSESARVCRPLAARSRWERPGGKPCPVRRYGGSGTTSGRHPWYTSASPTSSRRAPRE